MDYQSEIKEIMKKIKNDCDEFLSFTCMSGNEDSYTDSLISSIIQKSELLKKIDDFRFFSKSPEEEKKEIDTLLFKYKISKWYIRR